MKLYFHDKAMDPIQHYKQLVLFDGQTQTTSKKPKVAEDYNEIVFVEPAKEFISLIQSAEAAQTNLPPSEEL